MPSPLPGASAGVESIRTLALIGPAAAGKTSLAEALLAAAGAIGTPGSLERGTTASDFDPLERRMQHSLNSSVLHLTHDGTRVHFIDTPGAADFLGQSLPALEAVETAAVVINAATGVEPMTVRMMDHAAARQRDRLIVVNKIDSPGVDLAAVLAQIQAAFGKECLPLNLPDGGGTRVVDCFHNRQGHSDFGSVEDAHRALVEQVVEVDAGFVERYLEDGDVDTSELHAPLEQALREGHLIPVCFVSARSGAGVAELLDIIVKLLPHPGEANPPEFLRGEGAAAEPLVALPDPARHVLAHVFKVSVDPFVGRLGVCRIHQGTVTKESLLFIGEDRKPFKVGHLFMLRGKDHVEVAQALPGDDHIHLAPLPFPKPVHGLAIEPKRHGDEQRMWEILTKLVDEDPCLKLEHVTGTNETIVYGLGELHLRVLLERLRETYRFEVSTRPPRIAYRETITAPAEGHHRHKKQSGGAGQFGEVFLRVEPLPRGGGFEFVDQVRGGTIPGQFIPAVEKGVREVLASGAITGHPIVDVRVVVYDGKHHSVDSKEIAFVTAGRKAFLAAVREAGPIVLEPIVHVEITAPEPALGDITGDLASRRGMVSGTGSVAPGTMTVRGQAPMAELLGYQSRLNALTSAQGRYLVDFSHYEAVPANTQQQLVSEFKGRSED
jgi:elongation factor G